MRLLGSNKLVLEPKLGPLGGELAKLLVARTPSGGGAFLTCPSQSHPVAAGNPSTLPVNAFTLEVELDTVHVG